MQVQSNTFYSKPALETSVYLNADPLYCILFQTCTRSRPKWVVRVHRLADVSEFPVSLRFSSTEFVAPYGTKSRARCRHFRPSNDPVTSLSEPCIRITSRVTVRDKSTSCLRRNCEVTNDCVPTYRNGTRSNHRTDSRTVLLYVRKYSKLENDDNNIRRLQESG